MKPSAPEVFHAGMAGLDAGGWNRLAGDHPFLRHEFLPRSRRRAASGPRPAGHRTIFASVRPASPRVAAPLYEKAHSWGEFVFDFAWARA